MLVPGVTYRVDGPPADTCFVRGAFVQLTSKGRRMVARAESVDVLCFYNLSSQQTHELEGVDRLDGLVAVLPEAPNDLPSGCRELAVRLISGTVAQRIVAAATLGRLTHTWVLSLLWNQARYDDERDLLAVPGPSSVRLEIFQVWAQGNPVAVLFVETQPDTGTSDTVARRFLAQARSLHFFDILLEELASTDANVRRAAVEEVGVIGRQEFIPALERLVNDDNPSVAIKATYVLRTLGSTGPQSPARA